MKEIWGSPSRNFGLGQIPLGRIVFQVVFPILGSTFMAAQQPKRILTCTLFKVDPGEMPSSKQNERTSKQNGRTSKQKERSGHYM